MCYRYSVPASSNSELLFLLQLDSLLQDYWKLEKSLKEKEIETKNVQDIATKRTEQNHKIGQQRDGLAKQVWEYDDLLKQTREQRDVSGSLFV